MNSSRTNRSKVTELFLIETIFLSDFTYLPVKLRITRSYVKRAMIPNNVSNINFKRAIFSNTISFAGHCDLKFWIHLSTPDISSISCPKTCKYEKLTREIKVRKIYK